MFRLPASPAMTKNVQIAGFASNDVSTSSFPSLPRESVSIWHTQPLSECILRHITRPRWQCLHFHLARSTDCRASHSNDEECSDCRLRTAMTKNVQIAVLRQQWCFDIVIPELVFLFSSFPSLPRESVSIWHTQPLLECILRHMTRSRWQCLHFHLARSTLVRAHSEAHFPLQVAQ